MCLSLRKVEPSLFNGWWGAGPSVPSEAREWAAERPHLPTVHRRAQGVVAFQVYQSFCLRPTRRLSTPGACCDLSFRFLMQPGIGLGPAGGTLHFMITLRFLPTLMRCKTRCTHDAHTVTNSHERLGKQCQHTRPTVNATPQPGVCRRGCST